MINIDELKKKIIYRSNYRGTKEMDNLLGAFTKKYINNLNENDLLDLEKLLNIDDTNLYNFYNGFKTDFEFENNNINFYNVIRQHESSFSPQGASASTPLLATASVVFDFLRLMVVLLFSDHTAPETASLNATSTPLVLAENTAKRTNDKIPHSKGGQGS